MNRIEKINCYLFNPIHLSILIPELRSISMGYHTITVAASL